MGFNLCGTTRCEPMGEQSFFFERWLSRGYAEGLPYLHRYTDRRADPRLLMPEAQTIVVCAVNYRNALSAGYPKGFDGAKVASYALNADYHTSIKAMLRELLTQLRALYPSLDGRMFVDTAPLLEKALAVRAGLGGIGRNSLLITPEYGSFVHLGELLLNMPCDCYDTPSEWNPCGSCSLCLKRCPVGAINPDRTIDPRRCISARTLESEAGELTLNGWVCGCDECQNACPHNAGKPIADNPRFAPTVDPLQPSTQHLLQTRTLDATLASTPIARAFKRRNQ
ncbi:MAG: tRNA epoxyqueuosine(34) reductase QueG [Rikenellaceae bacterium]|nr:tRNA epoxyqueuosine(34) reductase QueG [Rikenellaceae bacterium]